MFFDRLLKRRPAAATTVSQQTLAELALGHADLRVRRDAVRRLASLGHLREILSGDGDAGLREIAFGRYRNLLSGVEDAGLSLEERLAEVAQSADPRLIEQLALEGQVPEVRQAAIGRIDSPTVLVHCVLHDPRAANRGAALVRIHDRQSLEQIVRRIGKKDKAVYRDARERLRRLAAEEERPRRALAQAVDLCERAEHLGRLEQWAQDRALLDHLDRQWAEIAGPVEASVVERFQKAREAFLAAYEARRQADAAQIAAEEARLALSAARESLLVEAEQSAALDSERGLTVERERLAAAWAALEPLPDHAERVGFDTRFNRALAVLDGAIAKLAERRRAGERLRKAVAKAGKLVAESRPLDRAQVFTLIEQGRGLAKVLPGDALGETFAGLAERLEARLQNQRKEAEELLAQLPARLLELESAVESGELKRADPLHGSLLAGIEMVHASGLKGARVDAVVAGLRLLGPRLKDLQHWRRWGADQHREALCQAMETLVGQDLPLAAVAERLHVLQTDWKGLDQSGSPANRPLWARFHTASEAVYARCRPLLEAQAAQREASRVAREAVCRQLEDFLNLVDWTRIDWRRVMQAERETRQAWAAIGTDEIRERRALDRRFHQAIKELDRRLEAERGRNQAFKQGLIGRVRVLADQPDLDAAIEETKSLQRQWHTTVPARQREENRLWGEFRSACDALFERRAALHQAQRTELDANLAARDSLCTQALALAESAQDSKALAMGWRELEQGWRDMENLPLPRQGAAALTRRWHEVQGRIGERRRQLESAERQSAMDRLAGWAALCDSVERQVLGQTPEQPLNPDTLAGSGSQLPALEDRALREAMEARLARALAAATDKERLADLSASLVPNGEQRRRLCLELEIAAGVDSPPELAQERLKIQVSRLAERLTEGECDRLKGAAQLLMDWYRIGPAPADPNLDERLARVRRTLVSAPTESDGVRAGRD